MSETAGKNSLEPLFKPASIAVVGASKDPAKLGYTLFKNVVDYGFAGDIFPVNPSGGNVLDRVIYTRIEDIPKPIDMALISIPNRFVPQAIADLARARAKSCIILSSGFGEMEAGGKSLQRTIAELRAKSDMRILGPNCMGLYNINHRMNATYFWELPRTPGNVAFISQSGAYGGILFRELKKRNIGISKFISIGNQVDITHADLMEYLRGTEEDEVVALFVEELKEGRRFMEMASAASRRKPIVVFKAGRTPSGGRAAGSHTGSMAGDYAVFVSAMKGCGALLARSTEEFVDLITTFSAYPRTLPAKESAGIITISGGPCVAASDALEERGVSVPLLPKKRRDAVRKLIPDFGADHNPVDMTPQMDPARFAECIETFAGEPALGAILAINVGLDREGFGDGAVSVKKNLLKPIVAFTVDVPIIERKLTEHRIPNFPSPERAADGIRALIERSRLLRRGGWRRGKTATVDSSCLVMEAVANGKFLLPADRSLLLVKEYGIATARGEVAESIPSAVTIAGRIGYPVVAKVVSEEVLHKTEAGGVVVGIKNSTELRKAIDRLFRKFRRGARVLVQKMIPGEIEIIVGGRRDPSFGAVVLLGIGGIATELIKDVSIRIAPVARGDVKEMVGELRLGSLLEGFRGLPRVSGASIASVVTAVSSLLLENPSIDELDINPLKWHNGRLVALDARVLLKYSR